MSTPLGDAATVAAVAAYRSLYPSLYRVAKAMAKFEGWGPKTAAFKNLNPGNLRASPRALRTEGGFAVFADYHTGFLAMLEDLHVKCLGRHTATGLGPDSTLGDMIRVWAPPADNNPTSSYLQFVSARSLVDPQTKLGALIEII